MKPLVGIIMGSQSDWDTMRAAAEMLGKLSVPHEVRVVSAHRTPDLMFEYATTARERGLEVIIAGAGGAAHLPGMTAAKTSLPVLGVPVQSKTLNGLDSLLSIVQMPAGVPVATFAIGVAGATNAALTAAAILANKYPAIASALDAFREQQTAKVLANPIQRNAPHMTVGIVGAGQLGRMLALAGYPLGLDFLFLDPAKGAPAGQVAPQIEGEFTNAELLSQLARDTSVLTFDWENISVDALRKLPKGTRICPPINALAAAQDRVKEKQLFERLRIPTTRWAAVDSLAQLTRATEDIGLPGVLKTRRLGYDGKGQFVIRQHEQIQAAWDALGKTPLLYEELVPFDFEVSIIGARSARGEVVIYPLNGNVHAAGILRLTRAPYGSPALQRQAARHLRRALDHFRYTGILTIVFFVRRGRLIANEMAPRVHNSGHWTIEGAETSQFENHLRAVLGLPLGATRARGHCAMLNLIGTMPERDAILMEDGVHYHDYGKSPRPGRKLGHLTLVERSAPVRDRRARRLLARLASGVSIP